MTLVSEIVKDAFRESNLIPSSQTPTLEEQLEATRLLDRFIRSIFGNEAGDKLEPLAIGSKNVVSPNTGNLVYDLTGDEYVPLNVRLLTNLDSPLVLSLHPDPEDGARIAVVDLSDNFATNSLTIRGNGRLIDGELTQVLSTNSLNKEWFYRADLGNWVTITDISINDVFPFPKEFEDFFVIGLASRINPRNGVMLDEQSMMHYRRQRNIFRSRYSQRIEVSSDYALLRLTNNNSNRAFTEWN